MITHKNNLLAIPMARLYISNVSHYIPVIGLEVHCQLKTQTKIFAPDSYNFGDDANTQASPITLGLPGVLPTLNKEVLNMAVMAGLALNCKIASVTKFDRKHYFYPDLPKGYQISQYDMPYAEHGYLTFLNNNSNPVKIGITRVHMEEDAGKLVHAQQGNTNISYVDLNRAGVPLLEIVSEPDLRSAEDSYRYLHTLKSILKFIDVSECNMEEGSLRCDANISIRPSSDSPYGTRVEIKNLNSFKAVRSAINYEIERQSDILNSGRTIDQATVLWDADKEITRLMRTKEDAEDYRYFPEPDLTVFEISQDYVNEIKSRMPELPAAKKERFIKEYGLPEYDADVLTQERNIADYFERTAEISGDPKKSSNWVKDEVLGILNKTNLIIEEFVCTSDRLGRMIALLNDGKITGKMAKEIFKHMYEENLKPEEVIKKYDYKTMDSSSLSDIVKEIIENNQGPVNDIISGNERAKGFLIGQVMKATRGQAPPAEVNRLINEMINKLKEKDL